jgi:Rnl2 family RNA ligase
VTQPFQGYEKMAERTEDWLADEAVQRRLAKLEWVVTEKVHGAAFALVADDEGVRAAKRKGLLGPGESFFGYQLVLQDLREPVGELLRFCRGADPEVTQVAVHGELFGGSYPHPDVPAAPGVHPIQTGVWYCPEVRFLAYDVAEIRREGARDYLGWHEAAAALEAVGIPRLEPLHVGTQAEAMAWPERFSTTLPARFGLPSLEGNQAEGLVIRPAATVWLETRRGRARPLLKRKPPEFTEDPRYHQAQAWPEPEVTGVPPLDLLEFEARALLVPPRLASAISKAGELTPGDAARRAEVVGLLVEDLLEELARTRPLVLAGLELGDRELLEGLLEDMADGWLEEQG